MWADQSRDRKADGNPKHRERRGGQQGSQPLGCWDLTQEEGAGQVLRWHVERPGSSGSGWEHSLGVTQSPGREVTGGPSPWGSAVVRRAGQVALSTSLHFVLGTVELGTSHSTRPLHPHF